jgi:hypothetical protein
MASVRPRKTSRGIVYHARVRIKGAPPQSSVHRTRTHANQWAQATPPLASGASFRNWKPDGIPSQTRSIVTSTTCHYGRCATNATAGQAQGIQGPRALPPGRFRRDH